MRGKFWGLISFFLLLPGCKKVDCIQMDNLHDGVIDFFAEDFYVYDYTLENKYHWAVIRNQPDLDSFYKAKKGAPKKIDFSKYSVLIFTTTHCSPQSYKVELAKDELFKTYNYHYTYISCDCYTEWIPHYAIIAVVNKLDDTYGVNFIESY
jgi:hypothetical protein